MYHYFKKPVSFLFGLLLLVSCGSDDPDTPDVPDPDPDPVTQSIPELAGATADLSSLVAALTKANLVGTVGGDGPFTVFAPTNAAFTALFDALGEDYSSLDDFDTEAEITLLSSILTYHVANGKTLSTDLTDNQTIATVNGGDLTISLDGGVFVQDASDTDAQVTTADVEATNGVVHIINKVLLPQAALDFIASLQATDETIAGVASENEDLSSLVAALTRADLVTTIQGEGPFTVFAPTNAAFTSFLEASGFATLEEVPVELLKEVLLNHVIAGSLSSTDLETGYIKTSSTASPEGGNLSMYVNIDNGVRLNGVSSVTTPDVAASNGIIHIVDAVIGLPNATTFVTADPSFSTLAGLLTDGTPSVDFVSVLSTLPEGAPAGFGWTVFAPTNDAFVALEGFFGGFPLADFNENVKIDLLNYHVVPDHIRFEEFPEGSVAVNTLLEQRSIIATFPGTEGRSIDLVDGVPPAGPLDIIVKDIQTNNGIIHVIDRAMFPPPAPAE